MTKELRDRNGLTEAEFLAAYKQKDYPRPSLTADNVIFKRDKSGSMQVLLVKRGGHPYLGCWALPGGFVGEGEDADTAAARELAEETHVEGLALEQLASYSTPGRDPRAWTVSQAYVCVVDDELAAAAGDDADDARWFDVYAMADDEVGKIELSCGEEHALVEFECVAQIFGPRRARVTNEEGLAFDHANMIADAWLRLKG